MERPVFLREETTKLEVGMIVCLHPTAQTRHAVACISDTYVVADSGAVPLYKGLFDDGEIAVVG